MTLYQQYLPILLLVLLSIIFACLPIISSYIINYMINKKNPIKKIIDLSSNTQLSPYECGIEPSSDARFKIPIKFALVAILFIIFDVEIVFLFPWAIIFSKLTLEAKLAMGFFLLFLTVGFIYEWKKGALEW